MPSCEDVAGGRRSGSASHAVAEGAIVIEIVIPEAIPPEFYTWIFY